MVERLYLIIIGLFVAGAILMAVIHKRRPSIDARKNWIKYFGYLLIINTLIATVIFRPGWFIYLAILIIVAGIGEIVLLGVRTGKYGISLISLAIFLGLSWSFIQFSQLSREWLLLTVFVITIFDAFSQLSGQLLGRTPLVPQISPQKTVEGMSGGFIFAIAASLYLRSEVDLSISGALLIGFTLGLFALTGDLLASYCKRRFGVKDFSRALPGQGGFLDRFDSLLFGGLLMYLLKIGNII